jgi:hypothetical protein
MILNLQHIQIKIFVDAPGGLNLDPFLEIFGRWRKEKEHPAEWVDLADYAHMSRGPGIVLIGQRCNFSLDLAPPQPGILYSAKKGLSGSHRERIASALRSSLELTKRLLGEKEFPANLRLRPDSIEIRFNDRLEIPNNASAEKELRPPVSQALDSLFGPQGYALTPQSDPAECYGFSAVAKKEVSLEALLERMAQETRA